MLICVDYDGTIATRANGGAPSDTSAGPMTLLPGAKDALLALKRAGHKLMLYSSRSNMAYRKDWSLNPMWYGTSSHNAFDKAAWEAQRTHSEALHAEMVAHVKTELPGVFAAIDGGLQGKPVADLFLDDRGFRVDTRKAWRDVALLYGDPPRTGRGVG